MRILFYVFPPVLPQGPQFNAGWATLLAQLMRGLAGAGRDQCHLVAGRRFEPVVAAVGGGLSASYVDEIELLRRVREADPAAAIPTEMSRRARAKNAGEDPAVRVLLSMLADRTGDFDPDVVITFSMRADYLKAIWPRACVLQVESGAFSRFPYPFTLLFDHLGMYSDAGPSRLDPAGLVVGEESMQFAAELRDQALQRFRRTDPFAAYDFRSRFSRLALLPLQVSNYYSFDEQSPHRTQFEYLVEALSQAPPDVGVIVTEYIQWGEVFHSEGSSENLQWLRSAFPNFIFHEAFRKFASPSQYLLAHVDGAYTVASNLGYQALLSGKRLGCGTSSYLLNVAHDRDAGAFFRAVGRDEPAADRLAFLAWYLERYLVPEELYSDGGWFSAYLESRVGAAGEGSAPAESFPRVADLPTLRRLWLGGEDAPRPSRYETPLNRRIHALAQAELDAVPVPGPPDFSAFAESGDAGPRDAYLLLNDTRALGDGLHLGGNAVTSFLEAWMAHAGFACLGRASTGEECRELLAVPDLGRVKLVILNGEGSLHHDNPRILELMTFCRELKSRGIPSVLINSVWHENGARPGSLLDTFEIVSVRESASLEAIQPWRAEARLVPDLAFAAFHVQGLVPADTAPPPARSRWSVTDHADARTAEVLHGFAEAHGFPFHVMGRQNVEALIREPLRTFEAGGRPFPRVLQSPAALRHADACLAGRFSGLVAGMCAGVSVVVLPSDPPQVQSLLRDAGIAREVLLGGGWPGLGCYRQLDAVEASLAAQGDEVRVNTVSYVARALREIDVLMQDVTRVGRG